MNRVLITGATGFIGFELTRQICALGLRPRVLVRRPHRAPLLAALDVEPVYADMLSRSSLARAVDGVDTIFHLAARATFEPYRRLKPTIVDGSEWLMRAAADAGCARFVFASSLFVYGNQTAPIDADTVPCPALDYGRAKLEAEQRLAEIATARSIALASIRLPHVYGGQDALFDQIRKGFVIFPGGMRNRCGHLHVGDAARLLIAAAQQNWTGASAVADDHSADWIEFFQLVRDLLPRTRLLRLPKWLGYAGAAALSPVMALRSTPTLYTSGTVTGFNLEIPVVPGLLWNDLGISPRYPTIREGIPAVLDGYVHFRWRHPLLDSDSN